MFEVIFLERMEIEHLLRYLDTEKEDKDEEERISQLHRIRSRHIIRSRVRYWLNDIVDEMRKKSPASVQKWVDSIQIPASASAGEQPTGPDAVTITSTQDNDPTAYVSNFSRSDQLAGETVPQAEGRDRPVHSWTDTETGEPPVTEPEDDLPYGIHEQSDQLESVLIDSNLKKSISTSTTHGLPMEPQTSSLATSTPKALKPDECAKQMPVTEGAPTGLSIRNFLSKKSLLGKFNRSGSNLEQSAITVGESVMGVSSSEHPDHVEPGRRNVEEGGVSTTPSPFVVGKSKINEFYDKLNMNKAKYGLMKAKNLDIRNMLSGGSRESADAKKITEAQSIQFQSAADVAQTDDSAQGYEGELDPLASESEHERSVSLQHHEPLEVSVVDVDPTDPYEFSFDESFPKSDELIPGMISEEDEEEKENILDGASVMPGHGYGYDAFLNPPKPKTHRMGIGRIGRSSSENPRATARRYNLMEIGRSFSEMNDDDDSFAISECNNSCPNPSSLNTSSSINNGSNNNLTRSVPVSPIPRTSSKLSIQQDHPSQHQLHQQQQQQQLHQQQQSSPRRRSTMLVKDSSLQSDSSRCSSVESLLNARKPDPEKILLNLGFGPAPHSTDVLAKIPKRFLKPSQVRGVDTEAFLRQQQLSMHIHENSVLGYRGLVADYEKLHILQRFQSRPM
uniref:ITPR-interacting domain-containing protein n=1 Tax=Anopheles christyi TaxID=43041 RepID=A0A182JVL4_9DIPT